MKFTEPGVKALEFMLAKWSDIMLMLTKYEKNLLLS